MLVSEASDAVRRRVVDWCRERGLVPYDRRSGEGLLRNLVVREGRRTGQLQARVVSSPVRGLDLDSLAQAAQPLDSLLWTQLDSVAEVTMGGQTELVSGVEYIEEELGDLRIRISPEAPVSDQHGDGGASVLDGRCRWRSSADSNGSMTCTRGSARSRCSPGSAWWLRSGGLRSSRPAVADAISNARLNEITNVQFFAGDVQPGPARARGDRAGRPGRAGGRSPSGRAVAEGRSTDH